MNTLTDLRQSDTARDTVEHSLVERLIRDREFSSDTDDTFSLCQQLLFDAGLMDGFMTMAIARGRPGWREAFAHRTVTAVLALYRDTDATTLQELVDDALEAVAWRFNDRQRRREIAA